MAKGFYDLPESIRRIYGTPMRAESVTFRTGKRETISVTNLDGVRHTWTYQQGKGWVMTGEVFTRRIK